MSTTLEYKNYVLEQLSLLGNIRCRPMMGEYLLYYNGVLFGGICDNRFLIKITDSNKHFGLAEQQPYQGAKMMYLVDNIEDAQAVKFLVLETCKALPAKK